MTPDAAPTTKVTPADFTGDEEALKTSVVAWRANPTTGHLGDVLAFGVHSELVDPVLRIAREAADKGKQMSLAQRLLAQSLLDPDSPPLPGLPGEEVNHFQPFQRRMRELRRILQVAPDNPLALLDFAQLKLASGDEKTAKRVLMGALSLAPRNRTVIRTVARFWVHLGERDKAHALVARALRETDDPWLMASEIALAENAESDSLYLARGRRLLKEKRTAARHLPELAGAIASVDLRHGSYKSARENARISMIHPNDNVAAQAVIEQELLGISLEGREIQTAIGNSSEAKVFSAWIGQDAEQAWQFAQSWHEDEPFSSRPIQFISTIHALKREYQDAISCTAMGLRADPRDPGLWTTVAYAFAATNRVAQAEHAISRVRSLAADTHGPFVTATEGLLALQRGDFLNADLKYRGAIDELNKRGRRDLSALAMAHYSRWAKEVGHPRKGELSAEAVKLVSAHPCYDALLVLEGEAGLKDALILPEKLRRTSQLVLDPESNTLTQIQSLTRPGAPGLIIKQGRDFFQKVGKTIRGFSGPK